jgi:hypothetical protein
MKLSPSVLSTGLLPVAAVWVVSAVVFVGRGGETADDRVAGFWLAMFLVGGPIVLVIAAMLITVRRRDRSSFQKLDWVALTVTAVGAVAFAGILLSMYLKTQRLNRGQPDHGAAANVRPACPFRVLGGFGRALCAPPSPPVKQKHRNCRCWKLIPFSTLPGLAEP